MRRNFYIIILILAIAVFGFSGWQLYSIYHSYEIADKEYSELEEKYLSERTDSEEEETGEKWDIDFDSLSEINSDTVAWLVFPACSISYPIVQTNDNEYYLTHTFENSNNHSGAIFLDYLNSADFSDYNSIIYGHNMKNGTMFGSLKKLYQNTNLRTSNPYFYLILPEKRVLTYEIFSYYISDDNSPAYNIVRTETDFQSYINYCLKNSIENTGINPGVNDKILTLATCYGAAGTSKRFFVHGVLKSSQ